MEFDITTLIHEVKSRKPLWQRDNYNRSCRDLINKLWTEVAAKMGVPKELVKTKWKGLRDNFRSELRKIPKKRHHIHRSKWIYFSEMMFIKDQMTTRSSDSNFVVSGTAEKVNVDVDVYTMDDHGGLVTDKVCDVDDKSAYNCVNIDGFVSASTKCNNVQLNNNNSYSYERDSASITSSDRLLPDTSDGQQGGRHCSFNSGVGCKMNCPTEGNPMKRKKLNVENKHYDINLHNDDDFYFLMSFLPTIKTLSPEKRMFLRFKIQRLIYNEVYNCTK